MVLILRASKSGIGGLLGRHAERDAAAPIVSRLDVKFLSAILC
jgi:hypothetical protein